MLHGCVLDAFVNERRAQMAENNTHAAKNQNELNDHKTHGYAIFNQNKLNDHKIHDYTIFELAIRAFDIQSKWRDAFERQREYMGRDLFIRNLNAEKFSQRLEEINKYLDYIPIEKSNPKRMAYGKSLSYDEIRSIMGCTIPGR
jgi:hypothetical protein